MTTTTTTITTKLNFIQEGDQQSLYSSSSGTIINNIALDDSLFEDDIIDYNSISFGGDYDDHGDSDEESRNHMEMLLLCDNERSFSNYKRSIIQ